jgi:hypothetical protein
MEGARPCVVNVRLRCTEGHVGIGAVELDTEARRHCEG